MVTCDAFSLNLKRPRPKLCKARHPREAHRDLGALAGSRRTRRPAPSPYSPPESAPGTFATSGDAAAMSWFWGRSGHIARAPLPRSIICHSANPPTGCLQATPPIGLSNARCLDSEKSGPGKYDSPALIRTISLWTRHCARDGNKKSQPRNARREISVVACAEIPRALRLCRELDSRAG